MACTCGGEQTLAEAFKRSDAVFAGVAEPFTEPYRAAEDSPPHFPPHDPRNLDYRKRLRFRVLSWWKSPRPAPYVEIWTGLGGGDCGYEVETGKSYLVFVRSAPGNRLTTSYCSGNVPLVCASNALEQLGEPMKVFERFTIDELIAREEPYSRDTGCAKIPLLIGERHLSIDDRCSFSVDAVVGRDGRIASFDIIRSPAAAWSKHCPPSIDSELRKRAKEWRFVPASIEGRPVAYRLTHVSPGSEPANEAEHERRKRENLERLRKLR